MNQVRTTGPSLPETRHIRKYAHVMEKVELLWGSPEFLEYIDRLTMVEKDRVARQGFPDAVMDELFELRDYMIKHIAEFRLNERDRYRILSLANTGDTWDKHAHTGVDSKQLFKGGGASQAKPKSQPKKKGWLGFLRRR
jgi:hypothetical protein